jgi:polysaccharide export outer membrane protein
LRLFVWLEIEIRPKFGGAVLPHEAKKPVAWLELMPRYGTSILMSVCTRQDAMTRWSPILIVIGALCALGSETWAQGLNLYSDPSIGSKEHKTGDALATKPTARNPTASAHSLGGRAASATEAYRIGPRDVLEISVFGVPELSGSVTVADNGSIQVPLLGETPATGKTVRELQQDVAAKLAINYLQNPQVTVVVKEYNSSAVILTGEVNKPGLYPLTGEMTLLQLVASGGGFKENSDSTVLVLRNANGKRSAARFDVSAIEDGRARDPLMQAGDTVVAGSSVIKKTYNTFLKVLPVAGLFAMF